MEIPVEKKSSMGWLWILLPLILAGLLLWWLLDDDDDAAAPAADGTVATAPAATAPTTGQIAEQPATAAQASGSSIAGIMANPSAFVGQSFSQDSVEIASVPTDRGFWIRNGGAQMFALFTTPGESSINIKPGQTVRIGDATVRDAAYLQQNSLPETLDQESRRIVEEQPVFLTLQETNVEILSGAASNAATPAQ